MSGIVSMSSLNFFQVVFPHRLFILLRRSGLKIADNFSVECPKSINTRLAHSSF